jgi:hypothetical protein
MNKKIEERIKALTAELNALQGTHDTMVQQNQQGQQQFQQQVAKNQTRYAQLQGAIAELQQLQKTEGINNDNSIPASNRSHRTAHVRTSQQPQSR